MVYNNNGYVKLHRKMFEWEWWGDLNTFRLFVTILLLANWTPKKWRGRTIPRGSCWTSLESLASKSGLTIQQTRTAFEHLISTNEITSEATNEGRLVTVVNYEVYQSESDGATSELTNENADEQQTTNKRTNKRPTTTNKYKEYKKYKEVKQQEDGRSTNVDLLEILSVEEFNELASKYEHVGDLIDEVEAEVNSKGKTIAYPFRFVDGYARNKNWPKKNDAATRKEAD